jgi:hypothetical protein
VAVLDSIFRVLSKYRLVVKPLPEDRGFLKDGSAEGATAGEAERAAPGRAHGAASGGLGHHGERRQGEDETGLDETGLEGFHGDAPAVRHVPMIHPADAVYSLKV